MRKTSFVLGPLSVARSDRPQAKDDGAGTTDKGLLTKDVFRIHYSQFSLHPSYFILHTSFTSAIGCQRPVVRTEGLINGPSNGTCSTTRTEHGELPGEGDGREEPNAGEEHFRRNGCDHRRVELHGQIHDQASAQPWVQSPHADIPPGASESFW